MFYFRVKVRGLASYGRGRVFESLQCLLANKAVWRWSGKLQVLKDTSYGCDFGLYPARIRPLSGTNPEDFEDPERFRRRMCPNHSSSVSTLIMITQYTHFLLTVARLCMVRKTIHRCNKLCAMRMMSCSVCRENWMNWSVRSSSV